MLKLRLPFTTDNSRKTLEREAHSDLMFGGLLSRFLLADIGFTFLPLAVIYLIRAGMGKIDESFWYSSDWAFAAIILSSLALIRALELKIHIQADSSDRPLVLAKMCLFLIISSVVLLTLYTLKAQGISVSQTIVEKFQTFLFIFIIFMLAVAHFRIQVDGLRHLRPERLTKNELTNLIIDSLTICRRDVHNLIYCAKSYDMTGVNVEMDERMRDWQNLQISERIKAIEGALQEFKEIQAQWGQSKSEEGRADDIQSDR